MTNDRHTILAAHPDFGPLDALVRIAQRTLIGSLRHANAFDAHRKSRRIHHDEHVFEPAVLFTDQLANGTAILAISEHAGGTRMDAELMLDRDAAHVVART